MPALYTTYFIGRCLAFFSSLAHPQSSRRDSALSAVCSLVLCSMSAHADMTCGIRKRLELARHAGGVQKADTSAANRYLDSALRKFEPESESKRLASVSAGASPSISI